MTFDYILHCRVIQQYAMWYLGMNTDSKHKTRLFVETALLFTIAWGAAWAFGFLLGFG